MNRLLIAEDEKLIRQGLRAMVGRAQVPVGEVLECRNGEEALQILKTIPVDVLFTDVRMPRMDGLTLIRRIQEDPDPDWQRPEVVVISGHDDFNYAVEAMRCGSREYILKPVRRERVYETLEKLERIIAQGHREREKQQQLERISRSHLEALLSNPTIREEELDTVRTALGNIFHCCGDYVVLALNRQVALSPDETAVQMEVGVFRVIAVPGCGCRGFFRRNLTECHVGISAPTGDLGAFRRAFDEAVTARKYAFFTGKRAVEVSAAVWGEGTALPRHAPAQLARQLGSKQYPELVGELGALFTGAGRGQVPPQRFEGFVLELLEAVGELFARYLEGEEGSGLERIYRFDTVEAYRLAFLDWLDGLHCRIFAQLESSHNHERIGQAVAYVDANYAKSLNMAVVSNHISMNYSVFSQLFRERTGKSFVDYLRDLRIARAQELLADTSMKISEISDAVGFDNDKYFMRSFKAAVGVSPTQYRKTEAASGR